MEGWRSYTIAEIGNTITGKTPSGKIKGSYGKEIPFVTPSDFKNYNKNIFNAERCLSSIGINQLASKVLPVDSVIVTCIGSDMGKVALNKVQCITNQQINSIISNRLLVDPTFLYYKLTDEYLTLKNLATGGSTMPILNKSEFDRIEVCLPPLPIQHRIAEILSALDDKIELNRQMNHTLEQMAQAIYKHYFVDDIDPENLPEGWRNGTLGEIFSITMGQSPDGKSYNTEKAGIIFFQGRTDFGFRFPEIRMYTTEPRRYAQKYDTLVSVRAPVGDINVAFDKCCIGRGLAAVQHKWHKPSYTYYCLKNLYSEFTTYNGEGTVFGSINRDDFNGIPLIIPSEKNIDLFEQNIGPLDDLIFSNHLEINNLLSIRDYLLPKLISGEIIPSDLQAIEQTL